MFLKKKKNSRKMSLRQTLYCKVGGKFASTGSNYDRPHYLKSIPGITLDGFVCIVETFFYSL